jgi:hypothetical protein
MQQVDNALASADEWALRPEVTPDYEDVTDTLAAEVRALREELRQTKERWYASNRIIRRLEVVPAAIEALCDEADRSEVPGIRYRCVAVEALRAALRGKP